MLNMKRRRLGLLGEVWIMAGEWRRDRELVLIAGDGGKLRRRVGGQRSYRVKDGCGEMEEVENFSGFFLFLLLAACLLYTSPSPRDRQKSRMPSSA